MKLKDLNTICVPCQLSKLGDKLNRLNECLTADPVQTYDGDLLTEEETMALDRMCAGANQVAVGGLMAAVLNVAKNGGTVPGFDNEAKEILNNGICDGFNRLKIGDAFAMWIDILNNPEPDVDPEIIDVIASSEAAGDMAGPHFTVNQDTHTVVVPNADLNLFSVIMTLGSTLKLNSATIETYPLGSNTVAPVCNVDSYPSTLVVTKGSKSVTYTMVVNE